MLRRPTRFTRTDTLLSYKTRFRTFVDVLTRGELDRLPRHEAAHADDVPRAVAGLDVVGGDGSRGLYVLDALDRGERLQVVRRASDHRRGGPGCSVARDRSEERRVGKGCVSTIRARGSPDH